MKKMNAVLSAALLFGCSNDEPGLSNNAHDSKQPIITTSGTAPTGAPINTACVNYSLQVQTADADWGTVNIRLCPMQPAPAAPVVITEPPAAANASKTD